MSIRNLINPQTKGWLNGFVNTLNANAIRVNATNVVNFKAGSILRLQASAGAPGDIVQKDGGNDAAWVSLLKFGDKEEFITNNSVFTTDTGTWTVIPVAFQYVDMPAGDYFFYWSIELKNPTGQCQVKVIDSALNEYQIWSLDGGANYYNALSGFFPHTAASTQTISFQFEIKSITGTQVTSATKLRFNAFRTG